MKVSELKAIIRECLNEAMTDQDKKDGLRRNLQKGTPKTFGRTLRRVVAQNKGKTAKSELDMLDTVKKTQDKGRSATRGKRPRGY